MTNHDDRLTDPEQIPVAYYPENLTPKQAELVELIHDTPGRTAKWYSDMSSTGITTQYIHATHSQNPGMFRREKPQNSDMRFWLDDAYEDLLVEKGFVDLDELDRFEREAESPGMVERGNVTTVGEIDLTDEPKVQTVKDRPVKATASGERTASDTPGHDPETPRTAPPIQDGGRAMVELDYDEVFDIVRNADEWTARSVFEQAIETLRSDDEAE